MKITREMPVGKRAVKWIGTLFLTLLFLGGALLLPAHAATQSGALASGQWAYCDIPLPAALDGVRLVLSSTGPSEFYLYSGTDHANGTLIASSVNQTLHTLLVPASSLSDPDGAYHIRIKAGAPLSYSFNLDLTYLRSLTWDPGASPAGDNLISQPDGVGGDYLFQITTQTSSYGAWRSVLKVSGGEADLYLAQNDPPLGDTTYQSTQVGSDGIILGTDVFSDNQTWYLRVHASENATWSISSGDIYVKNLGTVSDGSSNATATIGPEGMYYFQGSVDAATLAWRLWLNGSSDQIYVRNGSAPVKNQWNPETADQAEAGQMLLVPPYLTSALYLVGVKGTPGSSFTLDSRKQTILTPSAVPGYTQKSGAANFDFTLSGQGSNVGGNGGFGYLTYKIEVPVQQIAWQVNVAPGTGQNSDVYLRKGDVPNRWTNNALSEAPADVVDSITMVPRTEPGGLTDGTWYVTVYGTGSYNFTLTSKNPTVTGISFINDDRTPLKTAGVYSTPHYQSFCPALESNSAASCKGTAVANPAADVKKSGWQYFQVNDINSQVGFLGWQLDLAGAVGGSEIALRKNGVPSRWRYRDGRSNYNDAITVDEKVDLSSTLGFLQQPGHPADIWYVGVNTPDQALGAFQLTTREIPAPSFTLADGSAQCQNDPTRCGNSTNVVGQPAETWKWFKVTIPVDPSLLGWDLKLQVAGGSPHMVVRRDELPADFSTTKINGLYPLYTANTWNSGAQWAYGGDWTGRGAFDDHLIMGLGSPLQPGTYYVGVSRGPNDADSSPLSYTLISRGVGVGSGLSGVAWPLQVKDLAFSGAGSSSDGSDLQPREAAFYRVTVPAGAKSWSLNMVPTTGEALIAVRQGALPNVMASPSPQSYSDSIYSFEGVKRQKNGKEFFYKYAGSGGTTITSGVYYLAVISEGQNPVTGSIGTGGISYTLTSVGEMPVNDKTAAPLALGAPVTWVGEGLSYGQQKLYRFRAPAGIPSLEIRLKNRTGSPRMSVRQDTPGSGKVPIPQWSGYTQYFASEGGDAALKGDANLITIAQPAAGDYTLCLVADNDGSYPDASYGVEVTAKIPIAMQLTGGSNLCADPNDPTKLIACGGHLVDQQVNYYQVELPAQFNGFPVAGWKISASATAGSASLRIAKGMVPGGSVPSLATSEPVTIVAPPYLSPGTWFIEVQGTGITDYTIVSDIISAEPAHNKRSWNMPDKENHNASGAEFQYPAGLSAPTIGDSGIDGQGNPIINPSNGDQGTDLAQKDWHFYRVVVPAHNGGSFRTMLEALSGTPELYIREAGGQGGSKGAPSPYHKASAVDPNDVGSLPAFDRSQALAGTMYGNWVPLDRRVATELAPGEWWLGVKAVNSNVRYRLKIAAGNVRSTNGPVDSTGFFQDLELSAGSRTAQNLTAGDMRYYRVTLPQSSATLAESIPTAWSLTLTKQSGDVAVFIRDSVPPGQGNDGNAMQNPALDFSATSWGEQYFRDWFDDNARLNPNPYLVMEDSGATTIPLTAIRPNTTYYLGVFARTDASFDLASTATGPNLPLDGVIPFINGRVPAVSGTITLSPGEQRLYRVDVPNDALYWHLTASNDPAVKLYLAQGSVPPHDVSANWYSNSPSGNDEIIQPMTAYPWQPGYSFYLAVENTSGAELPFSVSLDGRTSQVALTEKIAGSGSGTIGATPADYACLGASCGFTVAPFTPITLTPVPAPGSSFAGWSGACAASVGDCVLPTGELSTIETSANFTLNSYTVFVYTAGNGTVTGSLPGMTCSADSCSGSYPFGSHLTLTVHPAGGYLFTGWSGGVCTGIGACAITLNGDASFTAGLALLQTLTVTTSGTGSGSVNSNPAGIACVRGSSANCSALFAGAVNLTATASSNSAFGGWSGACNGTGSCSVTMDLARTVNAAFSLGPVQVQVSGSAAPYYSIDAALDAVATQGKTVSARNLVFLENVSMTSPVTILLSGGYSDAAFVNRAAGAVTVIGGSLKIRSGTLKVDRVKVK